MVWIILTLGVLTLLVVNGAAQQVRVVLFNEWQAEMVERRRREIEERKRLAAEKIRSMLAEKRDTGESAESMAASDLPPAEAAAHATAATSGSPARPAHPHGAGRSRAAGASAS
jgi:hypothetical protein